MKMKHLHRNELLGRYFTVMLLAFGSFTALPATAVTPTKGHAVPIPAIIATPSSIGAEKVIPLEQVNDIKAQPLALLAKFPEAGPPLAKYVAEQLTRQPALVDAILSLANTTSPEQASAIGTGIVRAMRTLNDQQTATYRTMNDKVLRSDNIWLKTSYEALGPNYRAYRANPTPGALPPRDFAGFAGGSRSIGEWKVGPVENERDQGDSLIGTGKRCYGNIRNSDDPFCHGMIVAVMSSDATSNGAVSTSPTL